VSGVSKAETTTPPKAISGRHAHDLLVCFIDPEIDFDGTNNGPNFVPASLS